MQTKDTTIQLQVIVQRLQKTNLLEAKSILEIVSNLICILYLGDRLDEGTMEITDQNPNYGEC